MLRTTIFIFLFTLLVACSAAPSSNLTNSQDLIDLPEKPILLSFSGDTMMAGRVADIVSEKGMDYPFTDSDPILSSK